MHILYLVHFEGLSNTIPDTSSAIVDEGNIHTNQLPSSSISIVKKLNISHDNSYDDSDELALPILPISQYNVSGKVNNNINFIF